MMQNLWADMPGFRRPGHIFSQLPSPPPGTHQFKMLPLSSTKTLLNSHLSHGLYQHGSLSDDLVNLDSFKSKLEH